MEQAPSVIKHSLSKTQLSQIEKSQLHYPSAPPPSPEIIQRITSSTTPSKLILASSYLKNFPKFFSQEQSNIIHSYLHERIIQPISQSPPDTIPNFAYTLLTHKLLDLKFNQFLHFTKARNDLQLLHQLIFTLSSLISLLKTPSPPPLQPSTTTLPPINLINLLRSEIYSLQTLPPTQNTIINPGSHITLRSLIPSLSKILIFLIPFISISHSQDDAYLIRFCINTLITQHYLTSPECDLLDNDIFFTTAYEELHNIPTDSDPPSQFLSFYKLLKKLPASHPYPNQARIILLKAIRHLIPTPLKSKHKNKKTTDS